MGSAFRRAHRWASRRRWLVLPVVGSHGAPICKALRRRGFGCPSLGAGRTVGLSLSDPAVEDRLLGWIRSSAVGACWLSLPRGSWIESGSPPVRCAADPQGRSASAASIAKPPIFWIGNLGINVASRVILARVKHSAPVCFERPRSSLAWALPERRQLVRHPSFEKAEIDLCQFGSATRSATCAFSWLCPQIRRIGAAPGPNSTMCSFSGRPHLDFDGRAAKGVACWHKASCSPVRAAAQVAEISDGAVENVSRSRMLNACGLGPC